jgi:hypothetical protein
MLLIEFADGTRLKMVGFGDAEGFGRQPDGLEVTELCGLNATMTPKTRRHVRSRRLPALRKSSDASRIELAPSLKFGPARSEECGFARGAGRVGATTMTCRSDASNLFAIDSSSFDGDWLVDREMYRTTTPSIAEARDAWWEQHSLDREARRDLDLEWREYAMARVESRTALQHGKRPRERDTSPERRQRPSRECGNPVGGLHGTSFEWPHTSAAASTSANVSATPTQCDLFTSPSAAAAPEVSVVQEAVGSELVRLLNRLVALAATGCGGCGGCAACLAVSRCHRCEQCNGCYEAASLNEQRQRATLISVCERIAASGQGHVLPEVLALPVLHACGEWEAAWEAGRASATFEQQLQVLWERSRVLIGCLDWRTTVMLLPPALQEAATLVTTHR